MAKNFQIQNRYIIKITNVVSHMSLILVLILSYFEMVYSGFHKTKYL